MTAVNATLDSIERKAQALIAQIEQLKAANQELTTKNRELTEHNRSLQTDLLLRDSEIAHLKTQLDARETLKTESTERNHQLRKEIDQYIADIDKCIEWLQNY